MLNVFKDFKPNIVTQKGPNQFQLEDQIRLVKNQKKKDTDDGMVDLFSMIDYQKKTSSDN